MLKVDGRSPGVAHFGPHFEFEHLPGFLQLVSQPFSELADQLLIRLGDGPELEVMLRKLVEAKDCAVRQARFDRDARMQTLREGVEAWVYNADGQPDGGTTAAPAHD